MRLGWRIALGSLLVGLIAFCSVQAQPNKRVNVWYFGYNAGLDFTGGSPAILTDSKINTREGCATICDENGQLLLYTDGSYIWNKNHQVIPNAANLGGNSSATQSGIIVPQPGNPDVYVVFSVNYQGRSGGVQYAVVDMRLNGGLGGIVSKNGSLMQYASEKLTAVRHCNSVDFWVIAHGLDNTFKSFLLTKDGISTSPIESKVGAEHPVTQITPAGALGYMKASADGRKLAVAVYGNSSFEVFDFDNRTGIVSNQVLLKHADLYGAYGIEFSPDGKLLYGSCIEVRPSKIYQFDLSQPNAGEILNSRTLIAESATNYLGALQVGPDGKLYNAVDNAAYIAVINQPNKRGADCQYVLNGINLGGKTSGLGLPNLMPTYFYVKPTAVANLKPGNTCTDITLEATYTSSAPQVIFQWYLDNQSIPRGNQSSFTPTKSGTYSVSVKEAGNCVIDSAKSNPVSVTVVSANPQAVDLGCGKFLLKANTSSRVRWTGAIIPTGREEQDTLTVSGTGTQTVRVRIDIDPATNCYLDKELPITFPSSGTYSLGQSSISACDSTVINAPTSANWTTYVWTLPNSSTVAANKLLVKQSGLYKITVRNSTTGCEAKDQVNVSVGPRPIIKPDERLCLSSTSVELQAGATGNNLQYGWQGANSAQPVLVVGQAGKYQVRVSTPEGCSVTRTFDVMQAPAIELGPDRVVCEGQSVVITPMVTNTTSEARYVWSTGATQPVLKPTQSGLYIVTINQDICQATDSVKVTINPLPRIKGDETICLGRPIEAGGLEANLSYLWEPSGETTPQIKAFTEGVYKVKISTALGCSLIRTITVQGGCEAHLYVPDAFTPNGDGINDTFRIFTDGAIIQSLSVYNRWGEVIFFEESPNPQWDGRYQEQLCQSGLYTYQINYRTAQADERLSRKGQILLVF